MRSPMQGLRHLVSYMIGVGNDSIMWAGRGMHTGLLGNTCHQPEWAVLMGQYELSSRLGPRVWNAGLPKPAATPTDRRNWVSR